MPKYAVHAMVLSEAVDRLAPSADPCDQQARADLLAYPDAANLGAIGPDMFFWAPDYEIVDSLYTLYKRLSELVAAFNKIVEPMRKLVQAADAVIDTVGGILLPGVTEYYDLVKAELDQTADLLKACFGTGLFAGISGGIDLLDDAAGFHAFSAQLFNSFRPPLQDNLGIAAWYWFDVLHYRRTGLFARNLVVLSEQGSPLQRAYAHGYLSHIATDLLGHAYVNQVVGGPYRTQVQRHVTAENYIDAWAYQQKYQEAINLTLAQRLVLPPKPLPDELVKLLDDAFRKTYDGEGNQPSRVPGGFLTPEQIAATYEVFHDVFGWLGNMGIARPTEPFSNVAEVLSDILHNLIQPPPSPPASGSTHSCGWRDILSFGTSHHSKKCYHEFFDNVGDYLAYLGELIVYALETLGDIWNLLTSLLATAPTYVILALLYAAQLFLYDMYMANHEKLAIEGYVLPYPSALDTSVGRNLVTPALGCSKFPQRYLMGATSHLVCPWFLQELPPTQSDFFASSGDVYPDQFIRLRPFNLVDLEAYASASTPVETRARMDEKRTIGNAVEMTRWLISNSADSLKRAPLEGLLYANWNLDADRGYGYKAWTGTIPTGLGQLVEFESYV